MKAKYALFGFILFSMLAFTTMVQAASYSIGVSAGTETTYEVKTVDNSGLKDCGIDDLGDFTDGDKVGDKCKTVVTKVEEEDDYWKITYDSWDWTSKDFKSDPDDEDKSYKIKKDPDDVSGSYPQISGCAKDVAKYIKAIDWNDDYEIDGTTVTSDGIDLGLGGDKIKVSVTYDSNTGLVSSFRYLNEDDDVLYEYASSSIPGYEVPILLGVVGLTTIGLIYLVMKKK